MKKFKCIQKQYSGNEVVAYNLVDEQGNAQVISKEQLKKAIKNKQIEVINLQLSSDGRLVDKAVTLEKQSDNSTQNNNMQQILVKAYEASYRGLLQGGTIAFEKYLEDNGQMHSKFYNEMCNIFEKAKVYDNLDAFQVAQGFENYIRQKYNCLPMRLSVKLNAGNQRHYLCYAMKNMYIPVFGNWSDEGEHDPNTYLNVNNYRISGVCLDGTQPTYVKGINNEKTKNRVRISGDVQSLPVNATYVIVESGTSADNKYKNVFVGVEMTKGLTNKHTVVDGNRGRYTSGKNSFFLNELKAKLHKTIGVKLNGTAIGKMFSMFK